MKKIDWNVPTPRLGWKGSWDKFVGPGATDAEEWLQLGAGLIIGAAMVGLFWQANGLQAGWLVFVFVVVLALDLGGGLITNSTATAKRWYHRAEHSKFALFKFIAIHGLHVGAVAWIFADEALLYFAVSYGFLMLATALILWVPLYLQRPAAVSFFAIGLLGAQLPMFDIADPHP